MKNEKIRIVRALPEHFEQALKLLENIFVKEEPLAVSLEFTWEEEAEYGHEKDLKDGNCQVVLNCEGRVVGVHIMKLKNIDENQPEPSFYKSTARRTEKMKLVDLLFDTFMKGWTKDLPDCKRVLESHAITLEKEYRGRGIIDMIMEKFLELAEELQVDYVSGTSTSAIMDRMSKKFGLTTMRTLNLDEFTDETGKPLIKSGNGFTRVNWDVKKIKKKNGARLSKL